jgi:hypothetical protein
VYGWHPGNLSRCLNIFDTYERADQFAKTMTKLRWLDVGIFNPAMQPIAAVDSIEVMHCSSCNAGSPCNG